MSIPPFYLTGIGGLEDHVLKSATLSSVLVCPSFSELHLMATPILRVALEPVHPGDLATLVRGLRLLNQADACVEVILQESGEHVLVTAGEVHLQRCLDDLRERYAKVEISVSEPIVPFRETVIPPPLVDMTNESIVPTQNEKKDDNSSESQQWVIVHTQDHSYQFKIQAIPLPDKITQVLDNNLAVFKAFHRDTRTRKITDLESSVKNLSLANDSNKSSDHSSNNLQDSSTANPSSDKAQDSTKLEDHINNANNIRDSIQDSTNKDNIQSSTKIKDNIQGSTANKDHLQDSTESEDHINDSSNKDNTHDASLIKDMLRIRNELRLILRENPAESLNEEDLDRIVSFGPRYCGPNVLINCIPGKLFAV
ncbi:elongation factor-like GTPase 1 [Diaphorina citri]|uniref:Elongation factor-like GTPase 1 n=1 Tax=Diaphorina citri TaxID=121845 RepID=A0A1S3DDS8_DIACI|nr:elongation factor-like GTPase 1 [Diaphorina citri]